MHYHSWNFQIAVGTEQNYYFLSTHNHFLIRLLWNCFGCVNWSCFSLLSATGNVLDWEPCLVLKLSSLGSLIISSLFLQGHLVEKILLLDAESITLFTRECSECLEWNVKSFLHLEHSSNSGKLMSLTALSFKTPKIIPKVPIINKKGSVRLQNTVLFSQQINFRARHIETFFLT